MSNIYKQVISWIRSKKKKYESVIFTGRYGFWQNNSKICQIYTNKSYGYDQKRKNTKVLFSQGGMVSGKIILKYVKYTQTSHIMDTIKKE